MFATDSQKYMYGYSLETQWDDKRQFSLIKSGFVWYSFSNTQARQLEELLLWFDNTAQYHTLNKKVEFLLLKVHQKFFAFKHHAYSIAKCMEYTEKWAEKNAVNALPLPSYSSFYRIAMDVPEAVRILMREGERAYYNKASVYTRRDYESIASNDWWVGDTYTCDTLTLGPNGKPHRPYLTAWVDVRSGIFVGWYISFGGNSSQNSIYALRRGCLAYGMPNHNAYVDNGREYLTFDFGGRGHRAKKVLANGEAPFEPKTILDYMGVEMKNAIVQNSRAKLVERSFRNVKEHIMRLFPTYTGGSPEEKPEALKKALQRGDIPTDEEFIQKVDLLISGYLNYEPYYGSVPADKGKRRIDVYNEHLEHVRHERRQPQQLYELQNGWQRGGH